MNQKRQAAGAVKAGDQVGGQFAAHERSASTPPPIVWDEYDLEQVRGVIASARAQERAIMERRTKDELRSQIADIFGADVAASTEAVVFREVGGRVELSRLDPPPPGFNPERERIVQATNSLRLRPDSEILSAPTYIEDPLTLGGFRTERRIYFGDAPEPAPTVPVISNSAVKAMSEYSGTLDRELLERYAVEDPLLAANLEAMGRAIRGRRTYAASDFGRNAWMLIADAEFMRNNDIDLPDSWSEMSVTDRKIWVSRQRMYRS